MDVDDVASQGYCFQVDLAWRALPARLPGGRGADHVRRARAGRQQDELIDRPRGALAGHRLGQPGPDSTAAAAPRLAGAAIWRLSACAACVGSSPVWSSLAIIEIVVLILVGQAIGARWTLLLVLATSALGGWLLRREGVRGLAAVPGRGPERPPARQRRHRGLLVLVGGVLLVCPASSPTWSAPAADPADPPAGPRGLRPRAFGGRLSPAVADTFSDRAGSRAQAGRHPPADAPAGRTGP